MATKNYFISMKNHRIDSGFSGDDFNPTAQKSELTGVGATVVNDYPHIDGGFYEISIDDSHIANVTGLANVMASELVGADANVATLSISETTSDWHKQRLVTRNLPLRTSFDPVYEADNVIVYVIDSGVDTDHPEFANVTVHKVHNPSNGSYDEFISSGGSASSFSVNDDHGHGTAMASLVVGEEVGVARHAELGVVKISGADGNATISDVADGIDSMFKHRGIYVREPDTVHPLASVVCAWTFPKSEALDRLFNYMHNSRFLTSCAAGNAGGDVDNYSPAGLNMLLTVGASDNSDNVPAFSNDAGAVVEQGTGLQTNGGEEVDVFAPGVDVRFASIANRNEGGGYDAVSSEDQFARGSGTSISTAIVAGVSAIAIQRLPGAEAEEAKDLVVSQSLTGMLFQDPSIYSTTPNNIVYLENEYYASVWNTNPGALGESLISAHADIDISLNVANTVTNIESSDFAALPPALELSGNASAGWSITANAAVAGALTEDKTYNFILTATKSDNTQFNRHFAYSFYTGSSITDDQRANVTESYFIVDGSETEEIPYIKGMQAAFDSGGAIQNK